MRWGPPAWDFLYCMAFSYPVKPTVKDKKDMKQFIASFGNVLPCAKCKAHFRASIRKNSLNRAVSSKVTLVKWIMNVKNDISKKNGLPASKLDNYSGLCKKYYMNKL
jgi:hypothetical protein